MSTDDFDALLRDIVRPRYMYATLDDLNPALRNKLLNAPESESVYLWGKAGVGKTFALAALARQFLADGYNVQRIGYEKLCLLIRDSYKSTTTKTEWSTIEPYLTCDKLILEDISTTVSVGRQESDFALRVVLLILDSRSEDRLPTYITGNKPVEELEKAFDARVASRLRQGLIIHCTGQDRRKQKETRAAGQ